MTTNWTFGQAVARLGVDVHTPSAAGSARNTAPTVGGRGRRRI